MGLVAIFQALAKPVAPGVDLVSVEQCCLTPRREERKGGILCVCDEAGLTVFDGEVEAVCSSLFNRQTVEQSCGRDTGFVRAMLPLSSYAHALAKPVAPADDRGGDSIGPTVTPGANFERLAENFSDSSNSHLDGGN